MHERPFRRDDPSTKTKNRLKNARAMAKQKKEDESIFPFDEHALFSDF